MKYHFKIHKEGNGFWAEGIELHGCFTQANTFKDLQHNMQEALNLYVDEPADSTNFAAFPDESIKLSKTVVEVALDPNVAFAFLVRYNRIKNGLSHQEAAYRMGLKSTYSYRRLETSKYDPTLEMLMKIKKLFPDLSIDSAITV